MHVRAAAEFLKPADRKRQRRTKGRSEAEPVIRFAVEFLGDPVFNNLTPTIGSGLMKRSPIFRKQREFRANTRILSLLRFKYADSTAGRS